MWYDRLLTINTTNGEQHRCNTLIIETKRSLTSEYVGVRDVTSLLDLEESNATVKSLTTTTKQLLTILTKTNN